MKFDVDLQQSGKVGYPPVLPVSKKQPVHKEFPAQPRRQEAGKQMILLRVLPVAVRISTCFRQNEAASSTCSSFAYRSLASMDIVKVTSQNASIYSNLIQCYEAEFSKITQKTPNSLGLFELDTVLDDSTFGYLLFVDNAPAGLIAIAEHAPADFEVCEFYVVPCFRCRDVGTQFAHLIWSLHPGTWQIKQIAGAEYASTFWRKAIDRFPDCSFREDQYRDPYWGLVTRQSFRISSSQQD